MKKTLKLGIVGALVALALGVSTASPAFAESQPARQLSLEQQAAIDDARAFLATNGVDNATQDRLIEKFLNGQRWDSFSSSSVPIRVKKAVRDGYDVTVTYYQDGSVAVSRLERPAVGKAARQGLAEVSQPNGCTVGANGARTNCNVDMWVGLVQMAFKANYNLNYNTVSAVWGATWAIGGSCGSSLDYLGIPTSNIGNMTVSATTCGWWFSTSFNLQLTVSGGVAAESWW